MGALVEIVGPYTPKMSLMADHFAVVVEFVGYKNVHDKNRTSFWLRANGLILLPMSVLLGEVEEENKRLGTHIQDGQPLLMGLPLMDPVMIEISVGVK